MHDVTELASLRGLLPMACKPNYGPLLGPNGALLAALFTELSLEQRGTHA